MMAEVTQMAKKRQEEPPKGSPAWMATFSDLMNLLLCFFVLLFSMSTVDAQKLNELDDYINSMGKSAEASSKDTDDLQEMTERLDAEKLKKSEELAEKIEEAMEEQSLSREVDMEVTSQYVQLSLKGALLFDSGSSQLRPESLPIMDKVGLILERYADSVIEIEGHTDNVPISSARFADNNELSSARALSVFNYFMDTTTLDPAMLKHSGRGEYVPVADNSTPEGRAKNRRVEIKIYHTLSSY